MGLARKGGKFAEEWREEKMGGESGDLARDWRGGEGGGWGGGGTPLRAAAADDGKREELKMRAGGEEETEGGEGDTPQGGLDCLSFCRL